MQRFRLLDVARRRVRSGMAPPVPHRWLIIRRALALSIVAATASGLLASSDGFAESGHVPSAARPLGLREAVERTLVGNKHLVADRHRVDEQHGRIDQVGLLRNPAVNLVLEDIGGSGTYNGVDRAQTSLSVGWVIEPTARGHRVAAAQAGLDLVLSETQIHRLDAAAATAQWFLSALADQVRLENASQAVELTDQTTTAIAKRVRAGRAAQAELTRSEAELALAELARDDVTHDLDVAYHRLAAQWGEIEPDFSRVDGDLLATPDVVPFDSLEARLERNPRLVQLAAEERLANASFHEARAERWMKLRPSIGMRHYAATDDFSVVAGFAMPLPVFNRGQGRVRETRATVARARADTEAARVTVRAALFEAHEELKHYLHRAETLREEVIPRLEAALVDTRRGFERGRYGYVEWRSLQLELLNARSELVEASVSGHRLVVALERLTGGEVTVR